MVSLCFLRFEKFLSEGSLGSLDRQTAGGLLDWERRALGVETSTPDWFDVSGSGFMNYSDFEGDDTINWKRGYSTLFSILLVILQHDIKI